MTRAFRWAVLVAIVVYAALSAAGIVNAQVENSTGTNVHEGDNSASTEQSGSSRSGDANGGQVVGVVSSGRTSVDATNQSVDSEVTSGDAVGSNVAEVVLGLNSASNTAVGAADITNTDATNVQDGDNRLSLEQAASQATGDGVAGAVIGVVTGPGGSTSVVASNRSSDVTASTGDANGTNAFAGAVGLLDAGTVTVSAADIDSAAAINAQEGDNRLNADQVTRSASGDGVGGQVIGVVSAGRTSVDAANSSTGVTVDSGDANSSNVIAAAAGHVFADSSISIDAADLSNVGGSNIQEGDNRADLEQQSNATSGDAVGGQVVGTVTSAGGESSVVASNTSRDSEINTGDATSFNEASTFVGLSDACDLAVGDDLRFECIFPFGGGVVIGDVDNVAANNVQEGDNRLGLDQTARAASGDGVGGMVLGLVSAGRTSVDARNLSEDVAVETGDAEAGNRASLFVGLAFVNDFSEFPFPGDVDVSRTSAENVQEGNNSATENQDASALSGDAVGGMVSGVVTAAGAEASVVLDNTSRGVDVRSGVARFFNAVGKTVGLVASGCSAPSEPPGD